MYDNPFDNEKFEKLRDTEFDDEVNNLIEWCEDLDYDKYVVGWHSLATSAYVGLKSNNDNKINQMEL